MTLCKGCFAKLTLDELDLDGYCFDCANDWPQDSVQMENVRELMQGTVEKLAAARGVSSERMTSDLVHGGHLDRDRGPRSSN